MLGFIIVWRARVTQAGSALGPAECAQQVQRAVTRSLTHFCRTFWATTNPHCARPPHYPPKARDPPSSPAHWRLVRWPALASQCQPATAGQWTRLPAQVRRRARNLARGAKVWASCQTHRERARSTQAAVSPRDVARPTQGKRGQWSQRCVAAAAASELGAAGVYLLLPASSLPPS